MSISDALKRIEITFAGALEETGETGRFPAFLGTVEGVVVVPPGERIGVGAVWCREDGKPPFQAILSSAAGLTFDNTGAGIEVTCGYPPGKKAGRDPLYVLRQTERGKQKTGGMDLVQAGILKAQHPQAESIITLSIKKCDFPFIGMFGGWYTIGITLDFAYTQDDLADLSSYIPTTPGYARYVIACWNGATMEVVSRDQFDTTMSIEPKDYIRGTLPLGVITVGYVKLTQGMSDWTDGCIVPMPHLFTGTSDGSVGVDALVDDDGVTLVDDDGVALVDDGG